MDTVSDEWAIRATSDPTQPGWSMVCVTDPSKPELVLVGDPGDMAVKIGEHTLNLYEWHTLWQRMVTLIECARTNERIGVNQPYKEPDLNETLCHACHKPPPEYRAWGMRCDSTEGCRGTYYPRAFVEARLV